MRLQDRVLLQDPLPLLVPLRQQLRLEQQVDHITEGEQPSPTRQHDDPPRWSAVELQSTAHRAAHAQVFHAELPLFEHGGELAVGVDFQHDRQEGRPLLTPLFLFSLVQQVLTQLLLPLLQLRKLGLPHLACRMQSVLVEVELLQLREQGQHEVHIAEGEKIDGSVKPGNLVISSEGVVLAELLHVGVAVEGQFPRLHRYSQFKDLRLFRDGVNEADPSHHNVRGEAVKGGRDHQLGEGPPREAEAVGRVRVRRQGGQQLRGVHPEEKAVHFPPDHRLDHPAPSWVDFRQVFRMVDLVLENHVAFCDGFDLLRAMNLSNIRRGSLRVRHNFFQVNALHLAFHDETDKADLPCEEQSKNDPIACPAPNDVDFVDNGEAVAEDLMALLELSEQGQVGLPVAQLQPDEHAACHLQHHEGHHAQAEDGVDEEEQGVASHGDVEPVGDEEEEDVGVGEREDGPPEH